MKQSEIKLLIYVTSLTMLIIIPNLFVTILTIKGDIDNHQSVTLIFTLIWLSDFIKITKLFIFNKKSDMLSELFVKEIFKDSFVNEKIQYAIIIFAFITSLHDISLSIAMFLFALGSMKHNLSVKNTIESNIIGNKTS